MDTRADNKHQHAAITSSVLALALYCLVGLAHASTPSNTIIENTALANYDIGTGSLNSNSNAALITTIRTPANVNLFQYSQHAPAINQKTPTSCRNNVDGEFIIADNPFTPIAGTGIIHLDAKQPIPLSPAQTFTIGEPIFIRVDDAEHNRDASTQESIVVTVANGDSDSEDILLKETDINTGVFIGYLQSSGEASAAYDCRLFVYPGSVVIAHYKDPFDKTDTAVARSLVAPMGRIFNSSNGETVNNIGITIIDTLTNKAAIPGVQVFADDGVTGFPSTLISGGTAVDSGGNSIDFPTGSYRFPLLADGHYRLQLLVPEQFSAPSQVTITQLQTLPFAPYTLDAQASYGQTFVIKQGPPLRADIPIDPSATQLLLRKTSSVKKASIGDFVQYHISLKNTDPRFSANNIVVNDVLPKGFRYQSGSARLNKTQLIEPSISGDASTLQFGISNLAAGSTFIISYVTAITADANQGQAINQATATSKQKVLSNIAQAAVMVSNDFMQDHSTLVGQVVVGECDSANGLAGARVYLENGSYVITDHEGKFHFEGISPGTHVVQLDETSLSSEMTLINCNNNTRAAGKSYSRFVDIKGGSLWQVNFHVKKKPPLISDTTLEMQSIIKGDTAEITLKMENGVLDISNYRLVVMLPDTIHYRPNSSELDNVSINNEEISESAISYRLSTFGKNKRRSLRLKTTLPSNNVAAIVRAYVLFTTHEGKTKRIAPVENTIIIDTPSVKKFNSKIEYVRTNISTKTVTTNALKRPPAFSGFSIAHFGNDWLKSAQQGVAWLYPQDGYIPETPAANIAIKHYPGNKIQATLNGERVNPLFFFGTLTNKNNTVAKSHWQGIHLEDGPNHFEFTVLDSNHNILKTFTHNIHYSGSPVRAEIKTEYSSLVADGISPTIIAVKFFDKWNHAVRPGLVGQLAVSSPYLLKSDFESTKQSEFLNAASSNTHYEVGDHGMAYIQLMPTAQPGSVKLQFTFNGGKQQELNVWLTPKQRDWIVVGVADAGFSQQKTSRNNTVISRAVSNNKIALFAKGSLNNDWLITASFDSSKNTKTAEKHFLQTLDPNKHFNLLGDNTEQLYEASSSDKLFAKIEHNNFYAMYGDFSTELNDTKLSKYLRNITGLKTQFNSKNFIFNGFAAQTDFQFMKDEIQGDGTSGLYRLSRPGNIVINSETITIETRDRFRQQNKLVTKSLRRHIDYNIDYQAGTVFFKQAIASRDAHFNPNVIVIDYETLSAVSAGISGGARAAFISSSKRFEIGSSLIKDENMQAPGELYGIDLRYNVNAQAQLTFEVANTDINDKQNQRRGSAYLAQYQHRDENMDFRMYIREQQINYGLGQHTANETGSYRYGIDGSYNISEAIRINGEHFHEENLATQIISDVSNIELAYLNSLHSSNVGIRAATIEDSLGKQHNAESLFFGSSRKIFNHKILTRFSSEVPLNDSNANPEYPSRHLIGIDYLWKPDIHFFAEHERAYADIRDSAITRAGVRASPWNSAQINTSVEEHGSEFGPRLFSNLGLTQNIQLTDNWSGDFSYDRADTLEQATEERSYDALNPNTTSREDFTAVSIGLNHTQGKSTFTNRIENRRSTNEDKINMYAGWYYDKKDGVGYSLKSQYNNTQYHSGDTNKTTDIRFSLSYRPTASNWVHLNRFDVIASSHQLKETGRTQSRKLVNNWKGNYQINPRNQLAFNYGFKYVVNNFNGVDYSGITQLFGTEYRHDIGERWDIGFRGSVLHAQHANNYLYSAGVDTGWNIVDNTWISVGYNFRGFEDRGFSLAQYSVKGAFIKLRVKFDQHMFHTLFAYKEPAAAN